MSAVKFSELSPARQKLIRLFQTVNFGLVQNLLVREGEPVFDPPPIVLMDIRLDTDDSSRPEIDRADFSLREDIRRLFASFEGIKGAVVDRIEVRAGIPRRVLVRSTVQGSPVETSS